MLKDLVIDYGNPGGYGQITLPRSDDNQRLVDIYGGNGWEIRTYANGVDQYLYNANAPASGTITVRMDVRDYTIASVAATPGDAEPASTSAYLQSDRLVDLTNTKMEGIARAIRVQNNTDGNLTDLTTNEKWAIAQDAFEWSFDLDYSGMSNNLGSNQAFNNGYGDCTEFAAASVALLRENGIHARMVNSFWGGADGEVSGASFSNHQLYEVYLPDRDSDGVSGEGHWYLMDSQRGEWVSQNGYGFGVGTTDGINQNTAPGIYAYSSVQNVDYSVFDV